MKRLYTLMFSVIFGAAILGSSNLLMEHQSQSPDISPVTTTAYYGAGLDMALFTPIGESGNNSMHKYYAAKTLIKLASHDNLSISDKDSFYVSGVIDDNKVNTSYRLQQTFNNVAIPEREVIISVDANDDIEILAGKFETNLPLALVRMAKHTDEVKHFRKDDSARQHLARNYNVSKYSHISRSIFSNVHF